MKSKLITSIILFTSLSAYSNEKQEKIIKVIEQEIKEISRLYEQTGKKDGELLLRLAELLLEKTKLQRNEENENFLKLSPEQRSNISKSQFFSKSQGSLEQAQKICTVLLKNHPQYKNKAEVFAILAYYDRERNNTQGAEENLKKATALAPENSPQKLQNMLALAETLFNKEKFSEAIPLYEKALKSLSYKWWTKDAYNLSWCYLRSGDAKLGLKTMLEVYQKSGSAEFISYKDQVIKDIGLFYLEAGRGSEAIGFYQKENIPFSTAIKKIHEKLQSQGRYAQAEKIVKEALEVDQSGQTQAVLLMLSLDTFSHAQKIQQHLDAVKKILPIYKQNLLDADQSALFVKEINKMAVQLQKEALDEGEKTRKADFVEQYLLIKKEIAPQNTVESDLLIGEAFYVKKDFEKAYQYYHSSAALAFTQGEKEFSLGRKAVESMLNVLGRNDVSEDFKKKNLNECYTLYLKFNPQSDKASSIYQKLFNVNFEEKKLDACEKLVDGYRNDHPQDSKVFEGLVLRLIELSSKMGRKDKTNDYVTKIVSKIWPVGEVSRAKAQELLASLQIESVQQNLKKGNKESALEGYLLVFEDPKSTIKAKKNSAYNMAVIYYEWDRPKEAFLWAKQALSMMDSKEAIKYIDTFLAISNLAYESFNYAQSIEMSFLTFKQICHESITQKDQLFKNAFLLSLAVGQVSLGEGLRHLGEKCGLDKKIIHEASVRLIDAYKNEEKWLPLEKLIEENGNDTALYPQFIIVSVPLLKAYERTMQQDRIDSLNKKIKSWISQIDLKDSNLDANLRHVVLHYRLDVWKKLIFETKNLKFTFPEEHFNSQVKLLLKNLGLLTEELKKIQQIASSSDLVSTSLELVSLFAVSSKQLTDFVPPGDKSPEYQASFKNSMKETAEALLGQANFLKKELKTTVSEKGLLTNKNQQLFWSDKYPITPYFNSNSFYYWMDRGGQK